MYNGNVVVPLSNGSFKIRIPIQANYNTYKVAYVKDGKIQENFKATYSNGFIEFTTTHLSEYVVYGTNNVTTNPKPEEKPDTSNPSTKPEEKPDTSNPSTKPEEKPDISNPSTKPEEKPDISNPSSKPEQKPNNGQNTEQGIDESTVSTEQNQNTNTDVKDTVRNKEAENQQNPKTLDGIQFYVILLGLGCVTLIGSVILFKRKRI